MLAAAIPIKIPTPWANGAVAPYIRAIPIASQIGIQAGAASFTDGMPPITFTPIGSGGVPPWGADVNGIINQMTAWLRWQQAGVFPLYDSAFSTAIGGYPAGATLAQAAFPGRFWRSAVDNNLTNPDAGGANWLQIPLNAPVPTIQRLLAGSGNYSPTVVTGWPCLWARVKMVGPGAGGGAAFSNNGNTPSADASFGGWTAIRGNPGLFGGNGLGQGGLGGTGGANGTGTLVDRIDGGDGQSGGQITAVNGITPGGNGGSNPRGGAGRGNQGAGSDAAANSGGGGGGGSGFANPNGNGGGGGGSGEYVEFIITAPVGPIAYVVPSGANGGVAGIAAGGRGGDSIITVEEHYAG